MLMTTVLQRDRPDEALAVLKQIHADPQDPEGHFAMREFYAMKEQFRLEDTTATSVYKEIFTRRHNLKRLALGFGIMFGGQCTGTLVINCTMNH